MIRTVKTLIRILQSNLLRKMENLCITQISKPRKSTNREQYGGTMKPIPG
jgi:hypothetical protein